MLNTDIRGAVLQKRSGERDGRDVAFLLSLDCHAKQMGDEGDRPQDVSFFHLREDFPNATNNWAPYLSLCSMKYNDAKLIIWIGR